MASLRSVRGGRENRAEPPEAEVARPLGELGVADPLRRDEDDYVEDGRADGEDAPQDGHGARVSVRQAANSYRSRFIKDPFHRPAQILFRRPLRS